MEPITLSQVRKMRTLVHMSVDYDELRRCPHTTKDNKCTKVRSTTTNHGNDVPLKIFYSYITFITLMAAADELVDLQNCLDTEAKSLLKIICNQGDFQYIVTISPYESSPVRIQFSLYRNYPEMPPEIFVKSNRSGIGKELHAEDRDRLRMLLVAAADSLRGTLMIKQLLIDTLAWLKKESYHSEPPLAEAVMPRTVKMTPAIETKSSVTTTDTEDAGRPKLRTAVDVISRILWDDKLEKSCFTVGYMDRFAGLVEEKFNAFCWDQPLSAVDNDTLAIPQHRIQYFKYKQVKVWDKNERLDLFFGSTGAQTDIYSLIDKFQTAVDKAGDQDVLDAVPKEHEEPVQEDIDFNDLDGDPTVGEKVYKNLNRPNFFVAVRITSREIQEKAQEISDHIVAMEPNFRICCLPVDCMHITLATLRLNDLDEITHAVGVLRNMRKGLREAFLDDIILEIDRLDSFYQTVLYAKVIENRKFLEFAELVRKNLEKDRVKIVDNHSFVPHITLMKITRPIQRQFSHSRRIDPSVYHKFKDATFGKQIVKNIYLCPVGVDRREDGFYQTVMEMDF